MDIYTPRTLSTIPLVEVMGAEEDTEGTESDEETQNLETDIIKVAREKIVEEETIIKLDETLKIEEDEEDYDFFNLKERNKNKQVVFTQKF